MFDEEEYGKKVEEIVMLDSFDEMAKQLKDLVGNELRKMGAAVLGSQYFLDG